MIRKKIDQWLANVGVFCYEKRWQVIAFYILLIISLASQLPKIKVDTSAEGLLHKKDPALVTYEAFRNQFGFDQFVMIGLNPDEIFETTFLNKLKKFHNEFELLPNVDKVVSLVNIDSIKGEGDELIVENLLGDIPGTPDGLARLKERALNNPLYRNIIISQDGKLTVLVITPKSYFKSVKNSDMKLNKTEDDHLSEKEMSELVTRIQAVCSKYQDDKFPVHLGGTVIAEETLKRLTNDTMLRFTMITALLITIILGIFFKRLTGVILPQIVVNLALVSTYSLMAIFESPVTINTTVLPSFLLAVGIGDSVHLLTIFYRHYKKTSNKKESLSYALSHSGLALIMTSITTVSGLLSFAGVGIAPVAELGIFSAAGVMIALFLTLTLLPAMLSVTPLKNKSKSVNTDNEIIEKMLVWISRFSTTYPKQIVSASVFILIISLLGAFSLKFSHNSLLYIPDDFEVKKSILLIDDHFNGSVNVEILIDTKKENGLFDPKVMNLLDETNRYCENIRIAGRKIGKATSAVDTLKEINKALHEDKDEFYKVPENRQLIAQEFLLYEIGGGDDLEKKVDKAYSKARIMLMVPWVDAIEYADILKDLEIYLKDKFKGRAEVTITGLTNIICKTLTEVIRSMGSSYMIAIIVISIFMILLIGDIKIGLLSMAPNVLPIIIGLGFMYLVKIPLDYSTVIVGSIAIGLVVDDTVHFFYHFIRYYKQTGDAQKSIYMTFDTAGRAMLFTTLILGAGFFVCVLAELRSTANFGLITGFTILVALIADFFLSPALLILFMNKDKVK